MFQPAWHELRGCLLTTYYYSSTAYARSIDPPISLLRFFIKRSASSCFWKPQFRFSKFLVSFVLLLFVAIKSRVSSAALINPPSKLIAVGRLSIPHAILPNGFSNQSLDPQGGCRSISCCDCISSWNGVGPGGSGACAGQWRQFWYSNAFNCSWNSSDSGRTYIQLFNVICCTGANRFCHESTI
ncbi:hypothetical protein O6H91_05G055200 [Diphasiastrum complanatum]|uniref:Uncharacterized protein n=1 Tax=Diphasiastrum complanatum TaxID=34168 RepID=A0ACC2DNC0_DIPCM|nr:hypothetical protein O6H91_05G055200 [Diphasiastrum complanatum]